MKLIVGLGNPGEEYARTRHNVGFMAVDALARRHDAHFANKTRLRSSVARCEVEGEKVLLAKPHTFMNLSGEAVFALVDFYAVELGDLLVAVDDIALPLGRLRLRAAGSAGGHNGLKSIIESLDTETFPRVRLGIERAETRRGDLAKFVLDQFTRDEEAVLHRVLRDFEEMVASWIRDGIEKTMSLFNFKKEE